MQSIRGTYVGFFFLKPTRGRLQQRGANRSTTTKEVAAPIVQASYILFKSKAFSPNYRATRGEFIPENLNIPSVPQTPQNSL